MQAALDALEAALKDAQPIYEGASGIVNSHPGFDSTGKVTDPENAQETVKAMRGKFDEIKAAMNGTGRALHEALKSFREANHAPSIEQLLLPQSTQRARRREAPRDFSF